MASYLVRRTSDGAFLGLFSAGSIDELSLLADELGDDGTSEYATLRDGFGVQWCTTPDGVPVILQSRPDPDDEGADHTLDTIGQLAGKSPDITERALEAIERRGGLRWRPLRSMVEVIMRRAGPATR